MPITTIGAVKTHIGIVGATEDAFLAQLEPAVEAALIKLIDRQLASTVYTADYYSGTGTPILNLREYPVTAVAAVYEDPEGFWGQSPNAFAADTLLTAGTDYVLVKDGRDGVAEGGRLFRLGTIWGPRWVSHRGLLTAALKRGAGNIKVSYTAGYAAIPEELALCVWQVCGLIRSTRKHAFPVTAESLGAYSYSLQAEALKWLQVGSVGAIVGKYKRIAPRFERLT